MANQEIIINPDTVVRRSEALLSSDLGDETIMMDIETGMYYGLNTVAGRIWALVEQPMSVRSLCDRLLTEYEISPEACEQEVTQFLIDMFERGTLAQVA